MISINIAEEQRDAPSYKENAMLGYCILTDEKHFIEWFQENATVKGKNKETGLPDNWFHNRWKNFFYPRQNVFCGKGVTNIFETRSYASSEEDWKNKKRELDEFLGMVSYLESEGEKLQVFTMEGEACVIGYGSRKYLMPVCLFAFESLKDYDNVSAAELCAISGTDGKSLPAEARFLTPSLARKKGEDLKQEKALITKEIDMVKAGTAEELSDITKQIRALQEQLEEKQALLMKELEGKMSELGKKMQELETQMFILDTKIYAIRCFTGEVVNFQKLREGANTSVNEPLVIHQKLRYMDEELGKHLSIYDVDGRDWMKNTMQDVLKTRDDILDLFAPPGKSMSLFRVSATGTVHALDMKTSTILKEYELYHGQQIAVMLRNGENVYLAWLDEDRIALNDDNVFYKPGTEYIQEDDAAKFKKTSKQEAAARYFILNVLNGVLANSSIFSFPEKVTDPMHSRYVIFSTADAWITTDKYGSFTSMLEKARRCPVMKGDVIYVVHGAYRDRRTRYEVNLNNRGIGDRNRTHDASVDIGVWRINEILSTYDVAVIYTRTYGKKNKNGEYIEDSERAPEEVRKWHSLNRELLNYGGFTDTDMKKDPEAVITKLFCKPKQNGKWETRCVYPYSETSLETWKDEYKGFEVKSTSRQYYVSVPMRGVDRYYRDTSYNVNFEVYRDEMISLQYLCTSWLKSIISNRNIGEDRLSYAEWLPKLKEMLDAVRKADEEKKAVLLSVSAKTEEWLDHVPDWDAKVCEWQIENNVHKFGPAAAKRFAKNVIG